MNQQVASMQSYPSVAVSRNGYSFCITFYDAGKNYNSPTVYVASYIKARCYYAGSGNPSGTGEARVSEADVDASQFPRIASLSANK